jgi:ElaB/YqjD/DUF883 family membrane-anchored ribosome-binding protein
MVSPGVDIGGPAVSSWGILRLAITNGMSVCGPVDQCPRSPVRFASPQTDRAAQDDALSLRHFDSIPARMKLCDANQQDLPDVINRVSGAGLYVRTKTAAGRARSFHRLPFFEKTFEHQLCIGDDTLFGRPAMILASLLLCLGACADATQTLADKYLLEFDNLTTQGQKYQAIIWALTELASLIDSAATRFEIEYEIGSHLHTVLNSVDIRDREMKKQFQELQAEVDQLKGDIDKLVNETRAELQASMKQVRKDIIQSLREIVAQSIDKNHQVAEKVQKKVSKSVGEYKKTTTAQAISYFIGFQILLALCIYFYSKYIQQIRFN